MERERDCASDAFSRFRELTRGCEVPSYACSTYRTMVEGPRALEPTGTATSISKTTSCFRAAIAPEEEILGSD